MEQIKKSDEDRSLLLSGYPPSVNGRPLKTPWDGLVAEWLRNGLQIRLPRFDSGRGLQSIELPDLIRLRTFFFLLARWFLDPMQDQESGQQEHDHHLILDRLHRIGTG